MKYTIALIVVILLAAGGWLFIRSDAGDSAQNGTLTIATSFYPLQFAAERIVGDRGTVINVGEGRDPHDVQLSTQDVRTLQDADLVVLQGAGLEPWGEDMHERLEANDVPVYEATEHLALREGGHHHDEDEEMHDEHEDEEEHGHEDEEEHDDEHEDEEGHDEHDHGAYDPHTWLDPTLFSETVEHLAEAISQLDPDNSTYYEENAAALQAELATLDAEYQARLASCTYDEVIISHDAFGYLAAKYDITMHAIAGLSTQDQPSATTLAELKEEAEEGVGAILLEENSVAAYGETLARETGLTTLSINPVAYAIPEGGDYLSVMRDNLESLATALSCNGA